MNQLLLSGCFRASFPKVKKSALRNLECESLCCWAQNNQKSAQTLGSSPCECEGGASDQKHDSGVLNCSNSVAQPRGPRMPTGSWRVNVISSDMNMNDQKQLRVKNERKKILLVSFFLTLSPVFPPSVLTYFLLFFLRLRPFSYPIFQSVSSLLSSSPFCKIFGSLTSFPCRFLQDFHSLPSLL